MDGVNENTRSKRPSIRDLKIERTSRSKADNGSRRMPEQSAQVTHKSRFRMGWWVLAAVLLVSASVISLPIIFSDTTINITPLVTRASFDNVTFNALPADSDNATDMLSYSAIEWNITETQTLEPTGREVVNEKASGVITVYNNYTNKTQRLIKNTRFETANGNVYRVRESIMVPGKSGDTPGSLDVTVYADEAGEGYNVASGNLTIPGLKSLPDMYKDIYAKIKTPIAGGYKGERAVVSTESKDSASETLRNTIKDRVQSEITDRLPVDTRYFSNGVYINYADTQEREVEGKVEIVESATVRVLVFGKSDFAKALTSGMTTNPSSGTPSIKQPEQLTVYIEEANID